MSTRSGRLEGLPQPRGTRVLPNPGPLQELGSLYQLPQSKCKPERDQTSIGVNLPPQFYPEELKNIEICTVVLILSKT